MVTLCSGMALAQTDTTLIQRQDADTGNVRMNIDASMTDRSFKWENIPLPSAIR
jgi:hypothetical protein